MPKLPKTLKRSILITTIGWLVVVGLFLLQYFILVDEKEIRNTVSGIMFLIFGVIVIPITLLTLIDGLEFLFSFLKLKWLSDWVGYLVLMGFLYLIGNMISFFIEHRVPYFEFKLILIIHIIILLWAIVIYLSRLITGCIAQKLDDRGIVLSEWLYLAIACGIFWLCYWLIRFLIEKLPIIQWIF